MRRTSWILLAAALGCAPATTTSWSSAPKAATPQFDPGGGTYATAQDVTVSCATAGATIHCTDDGSPPTAASPACAEPVVISTTSTLRALAIAPGYADSDVATATYTIQGTTPRAARPAFSPVAGTYTSARTVTISSTTPAATIHCTRDGTPATAASPGCPDPILVSSTTTLRAVATAAGFTASPEGTATYTLRVATPTFSPPAGVYPSARSVTISTITAGATVHCTQDGSTPSAASPTCAGPIQVSATATLRAIATAPGWSDSAVGSATYTIGQEPSVFDCLLALSTSRQLFGHQSVGNNIVYGPADGSGGGLDDILKANAAAGVAVISEPAGIANLPVGGWAETPIGTNGDPSGKVDDFDAQVRTRFGGQLSFAAFKFCFADLGENTAVVAPLWAHYQSVLDALEISFPGRIIHWTVPVAPDVTDIAGNTTRELLSELIRTKYGPTGRVFDLADLEAHDAAGNLVTLGGVRALAPEWSANGGTDAHLNQAGARRIALAYIQFMCRVKGGP